PQLINKLAPERWSHWGVIPDRLDYSMHDQILNLQRYALSRLLSATTLRRIREIEIRVHNPNDAFKMSELFNILQRAIWSEVFKPRKHIKFSSTRRALQREHLNRLIQILLRRTSGMPEDARALAWLNLKRLRKAIERTLKFNRQLDDATVAHLDEARARITKALEAHLQADVK
ncbi:MAG TPA: peptidase M43, partial [Armatimonadetes bacterium]|nr:peptidase M43 [Armatimonadota bacterium]